MDGYEGPPYPRGARERADSISRLRYHYRCSCRIAVRRILEDLDEIRSADSGELNDGDFMALAYLVLPDDSPVSDTLVSSTDLARLVDIEPIVWGWAMRIRRVKQAMQAPEQRLFDDVATGE